MDLFAVRPRGLDPAELSALPVKPGCYALVLAIDAALTVAVGRLGQRDLPPGTYAYCGSAQGPGGLRARVGRHLRGTGAVHWHVDRLRSMARVEAVWLWPGAPRDFECEAAAVLAAVSGASRPIPRFGSSDCGCAGHLVRLPDLGGVAPERDPKRGWVATMPTA